MRGADIVRVRVRVCVAKLKLILFIDVVALYIPPSIIFLGDISIIQGAVIIQSVKGRGIKKNPAYMRHNSSLPLATCIVHKPVSPHGIKPRYSKKKKSSSFCRLLTARCQDGKEKCKNSSNAIERTLGNGATTNIQSEILL
jgi:hypothetical protein